MKNADRTYKVHPVIDHLNNALMQNFSDMNQSIYEQISKFKESSSMKQYLQLKPIKQRFKWWVRCASSKSYLIFSFSKNIFDNFFNSLILIDELLQIGKYPVSIE